MLIFLYKYKNLNGKIYNKFTIVVDYEEGRGKDMRNNTKNAFNAFIGNI